MKPDDAGPQGWAIRHRSRLGDSKIWIEDVRDSPLVKEIVEIAGKERIKDQARRTLAKLLATHAVKRKLDFPPDVEALLATSVTEEALFEMADDMENMSNFREFIKKHGVELPR